MEVIIEKEIEIVIMQWVLVSNETCELEGPYKCEQCGGHVMLDATYLDQVEEFAFCPYCMAKGKVKK